MVHIGPVLRDHLDDLVVPRLRRVHQRGAAGRSMLQVRVGSSPEKNLDDPIVAVEGSLRWGRVCTCGWSGGWV